MRGIAALVVRLARFVVVFTILLIALPIVAVFCAWVSQLGLALLMDAVAFAFGSPQLVVMGGRSCGVSHLRLLEFFAWCEHRGGIHVITVSPRGDMYGCILGRW